MDLRQLTTLVAIADHGSFSAAARALYTVQSNVSGHIARLERELGVTLVDRQRGGLTEDGVLVVERARRILHELDDISAEMASRNDEIRGEARIGFIGTTARWILPQLLGHMQRTHPGVNITILDGNTTNLIPRLVSQHLDGAVTHLPVDDPELEVEPLFAEDLVLLVPESHELAGREDLSLQEVALHRLLLPPRGSALRRVLDKSAAGVGAELQPQVEIDGVRLMASLAFEGYGAAIVPATAIPRWLGGDFQPIAVRELPRRVVGWAQRRRPTPSAATRSVLGALREVMAEEVAHQPGVYLGGDLVGMGKSGSA